MQTSEIISAISEEISRLEQVRMLLAGSGNGRAKRRRLAVIPATAFPFGLSDGAAPKRRHTMSAAGRARIAAAQKARWTKLKKAQSKKGKEVVSGQRFSGV